MKDGVPTAETLIRNQDVAAAALEQYEKERSGPLANASSCTGFINLARLSSPEESEALLNNETSKSDSINPSYISPSIKEQRDLIAQQLKSPKESVAQINITPIGGDIDQTHDGKTFLGHSLPVEGMVSLSLNITHPFSRGNVHAWSIDPRDPPMIDPRYLSHPFDSEVAAYCLLHAQELSETEPLASMIEDGKNSHKLPGPKF